MSKKIFFSALLIFAFAQSGCAFGVDNNDSADTSESGSEVAVPKASEVAFQPLSAKKYQSTVERQIVRILQAKHYNPADSIDNEFSRKLFKAYINHLDPRHDVFLKSDVTALRKRYATRLDNQLENSKTSAFYAIYNRYQKRRLQINRYALKTVTNDYESLQLKTDRTLRVEREESAWPDSREQWQQLWRKKLVNQIIRKRLNDAEPDEIEADLVQRYKNKIRRLGQVEPRDVFSAAMYALTRLYDPHTAYFSPERSENFSINMNLQLQGIGALLRLKNGYAQIVRLISGGPAAKSGDIQPTDRIIAVGQGEDGNLVNVVGMRLDHTVQLIRGPSGSEVRLKISSAETGRTDIVTLTRARIELEKQSVQHRVMEVEFRGKTRDVGLITLPSFYNGVTKDMKNALSELKKADVEGIVLDLRNNGGGALRSALNVVGLFMPPAPAVQIKAVGRDVRVLGNRSPGAAYAGPLVVLVNRLSASASEIVAAALQDYGRAVVVGSRTFGKGTVQTIVSLKKGELKLTQAKFYRVTGDSTQIRGVTPDIVFPSAVDPERIGESSLPHALPWDRIPPTRYPHSNAVSSLIDELRANHDKRAAKHPAFRFLVGRIRLAREQGQHKQVSLNLAERRASRQALQAKRLELANTYRQAIGKEPFPDYKALQAHEDESKAIDEIETGPAGDQDEVNAYETAAARIALDLRRLLENRSSEGESARSTVS